jgi:hypothetical protein
MDNLQPLIDLDRYTFKRTLGQYTIYGTWAFNYDQEEYEPALVIIPANRRRGFQPAIVALSAAFKYDSPKYCAKAAMVFAEGMGMAQGTQNAFDLAGLIHDHLLDLLKMPNSPTESILVGEATIHKGDGTSSVVLIQDHVPLAQA